ncbi:MAG: tetratricopeptide repeat protein [Dehalococcoidia bacterium]
MSKGKLIGLALVLCAVLGLVAFTRLSSSDGTPPPGDAPRLVADEGGAPASGMLTTDQLVDFWRERVERNPSDYISYAELGRTFIRRARETGDVDSYTRAEAALREALELNPKYEAAISYLATVLYARHDFSGALETAQRVYLLNPGAAQALAIVGDANLELGDYGEAESAYDKLLDLSQSPAVYSRLAHLAELKGRPQEAIELMRRAAAEAENGAASRESRAWYHLQLGNLYFNTGDLSSAENEYERSLETFPDYVHALAGLAKLGAARADYDGSISLYSQVVDRYPIPEYVIALGDVYRAAGREEEAVKQYDLVSAIDRLYKANGVNTDLQMALYLTDHDLRPEEALRQARAEYERRGSIQAADVLAWTLYKSGRYEEALTYSQEALRLGTQDALILFHAGMIHYRLGDYEEARRQLERAVEINPRFSVLYWETAADTLQALQSVVRR